MRSDVLGALAVALAVACAGAAEEPMVAPAESVAERPPMARVVAVSGDVRILRAGAPGWTAAVAGDPLLPGDSVQTLADARAAVRFADASVATDLDPGTTIRMPERDERATRLTHLSGRLVARVEPTGERARFEVELPPGTLVLEATAADPTGTIEARVDVDEGRTEIAMVRGAARLDRTHGEAIDVNEDRFVTVGPGGEVLARGWSARSIVVIEPEANATVRTRSEVTFRWLEVRDAEAYTLAITGPDGAVREVETMGPLAEIPFAAGAYRWSIRATLRGEPTLPSEARALVVDVDRVAPSLSLRSPAPGLTVSEAELVVDGTTDPGARLDVDGDPVVVFADGSFHATRPIARGLAHVVFRVRDDLGNARVVSRTVTRR